jgi:hypothetical protein
VTFRVFRTPVHFLAIAFAVAGAAACAENPRPRSAPDPEEKTACVGGLCVKPDHVVARKLPNGTRSRCLVIAWDGTDSLPPTAKVGVTDDSPARPGVFAAIDMPSMREGFAYPIAADPSTASPGSAAVFAVRVDPAVRFADQRFAEAGDVTVVKSEGGERIVVVKVKAANGLFEIASFIVPKAYNGCSSPGDL